MGPIPLLSVEGDTAQAGEELGAAWRDALGLAAAERTDGRPVWWRDTRYAKLVERWCPHLPDLYRAMARGAGLDEDQVTTRAPQPEPLQSAAPQSGGCTSFAVAPGASLDGHPISGQTKDVSRLRGAQFQVLRLRLTDGAPSAITLTYPGWLFGHGFVAGGCAIFRNSLYVDGNASGMPYAVWGQLALHCPTVEDVERLTRDHPVAGAFHVTVADEGGGIKGIESGRGHAAFLAPDDGLYVHANAVRRDPALLSQERERGLFRRADSIQREEALTRRLAADRGRLTAPLAYAALSDHTGYPASVCRHQSDAALTAAAVVAEPVQRRLHVARGPVCMHFPQSHTL